MPFDTAEDLSVNAAPDWHSSLPVLGEEEFDKCEVKTWTLQSPDWVKVSAVTLLNSFYCVFSPLYPDELLKWLINFWNTTCFIPTAVWFKVRAWASAHTVAPCPPSTHPKKRHRTPRPPPRRLLPGCYVSRGRWQPEQLISQFPYQHWPTAVHLRSDGRTRSRRAGAL